MMDYYNLLGVKATASADEIRTAFRRHAKRAHPDAHPHLSGQEKDTMHRRFIQLAHAYETLTNPAKRREYDRKRSAARVRSTESVRPKAGHGTGAARRAGSARGAAGATRRRSARPPPPPPENDEELDVLMQEVQDLLGKFGLDMQQQFSRMMDKLLDWALSVFMEVVQALEGVGDESSKGATRPNSEARPANKNPSAKSQAKPQEEASKAPRGKPSASPDLEAELAALKQQVRATRGRARGHSPSPESIEEALQQIKNRKKS
ncbi:MAG: J domain-containing protein [SAR324 cluster bacterium]|nr:J domain-containing protein [SAR324 cluster bacterium]